MPRNAKVLGTLSPKWQVAQPYSRTSNNSYKRSIRNLFGNESRWNWRSRQTTIRVCILFGRLNQWRVFSRSFTWTIHNFRFLVWRQWNWRQGCQVGAYCNSLFIFLPFHEEGPNQVSGMQSIREIWKVELKCIWWPEDEETDENELVPW